MPPVPSKIILTGKVYIKYIDDIVKPKIGDLMLYLNDDAINPFPGDYENLTDSGYIKAKVYDGYGWQHIDINEFCTSRENKFSKKQKSIDTAYLCLDILEKHAGVVMNKSYRGHFARD